MIKVNVVEVAPLYEQYHPQQIDYLYNGLDCCLTREIADVLIPQVEKDPEATLSYALTRAIQTPVLEMELRGLLVNPVAKYEAIQSYEAKAAKVQLILDEIAVATWGRGLNPNSPKQLKDFFYSFMGLPEQKALTGGRWQVSTNADSLEKLSVFYSARMFIRCILDIRDYRKKISVLKKPLDQDGRIRTSYNIVGTDTGRLSSSSNAFGTGDNLQNWSDEMRQICVADDGMKMAYIDLTSAESDAVAMLSEDLNYQEAVHAGDVHTMVAKMVWPELAWTGDLKLDKKIAEQIFYRTWSYRDMAKRGGHGTNYYGQPHTMAKHLKIDKYIMEMFQMKYFDPAAFAGIRVWHQTTATELQSTQRLVGPMVTGRTFWSRLDADSTLRSAIAHKPQSMVSNILNLGMRQLWDANIPGLQLLAQVHDAVLIQFPEHLELETIKAAIAALSVTVPFGTNSMTIPFDAETGWNWSHKSANNLDGLQKWTGHDTRKRTRSAKLSLLDCRIL